jgi:hypothetical protein
VDGGQAIGTGIQVDLRMRRTEVGKEEKTIFRNETTKNFARDSN